MANFDAARAGEGKFSEGLKAWFKVFRIPFHTALVFPLILGMIVAWSDGYVISWPVLVIAVVAIGLATSNCFLANEYFDYETDWINREYNRFTGGSRVLPDERIPRQKVFRMALICGFSALGLGILLQFYFKTGPWTLPLGVFAMAAGYFYTAKPVQLSYRGWGEFFIGLGVGGLTIFSGYYLQTQELSLKPVIVSLPWVMTTVLLIWVNEFPDYESDKASGKNNLVVRLGKERASVVHQILSVSMWLFFIPMYLYFPHLPLASLVLLVPIFVLSAWNVVAMGRGNWRDSQKMEKICGRQIIYSVLMPLLLIGAFIWRGLA